MRLLVSVCSPDEAHAALDGGADLIDVKEPARGALGRADDAVMLAVAQAVAGRAPLSFAMGELKDADSLNLPRCKCDYIKFGLAGCRSLSWHDCVLAWRRESSTVVVPTAYADFLMADSPDVTEVAGFVSEHHFPVLLIDTFGKNGRTLFDWLSEQQLRQIAGQLRKAGCELALAGSLSLQHLPALRSIDPAWLAVRGAVCRDSVRTGEVDSARVRALKSALLDERRDHPTSA